MTNDSWWGSRSIVILSLALAIAGTHSEWLRRLQILAEGLSLFPP